MDTPARDGADGQPAEGNVKSSPPRYKRGRGYSFFKNYPKDNTCCQVPECGKSLTDMKRYYKRYKICPEHMEMDYMEVEGHKIRFCQQCGRFQSLDDFDGVKKSCRVRLAKHNGRRRKKSAVDEDSGKSSAFNEILPTALANGFFPGKGVENSLWLDLLQQRHHQQQEQQQEQQIHSNSEGSMPSFKVNNEYHRAKLLAEAVSMIKTAMDNCSPMQPNAAEDKKILQSTMDMLQRYQLYHGSGMASLAPKPALHHYQSPDMYPMRHVPVEPSFMGNMMTNPTRQCMDQNILLETLASYMQNIRNSSHH